MALHRDIYWVGRQWAVTGYGVQACDQKQKGKFDIEAARLWEDEVLESLRAQKWLNAEDLDKALAIARQRFPEPVRKTAPLPPDSTIVLPVKEIRPAAPPPPAKPEGPKARNIDAIASAARVVAAPGKPEPPRPEAVKPPNPAAIEYQMRIVGRAKFAHPWRIRLKHPGASS